MKYFRIRQDNRNRNSLIINKLHTIPQMNRILRGEIELMPSASSFPVELFGNAQPPDVLSEQIFAINESAYNLIKAFCPRVEYKRFFLSAPNTEESYFYYVPILDRISCLSEASVTNLDKSVIKETVIKKREMYPHVFRVADVNDKVYIVSLEFAEALLRRKVAGITLEKVGVENE